METGEIFEAVEEHLTQADGTLTFIQVIKAPVLNAKREVIGVQGIIWDVTGENEKKKISNGRGLFLIKSWRTFR
jgi:hypothetical protein